MVLPDISTTVTSTHEADCTSARTENVIRRESAAVVTNLAQSGAVINNKRKMLLKKHWEEKRGKEGFSPVISGVNKKSNPITGLDRP